MMSDQNERSKWELIGGWFGNIANLAAVLSLLFLMGLAVPKYAESAPDKLSILINEINEYALRDVQDNRAMRTEFVPIFKDLFGLVKAGANKTDKRPEKAVVQRLKKLISEAKKPTPASLSERAEAIGAARTALTGILLQAASSNQALPDTTIRIIQTQRNALRNAFGLLLERDVFDDIPQLLPDNKIDQISNQLVKTNDEIAQRQKAKEILDTIVNVAIITAKIAAKLA
jgi:hypothetical protein